jgi:hypothetical protein
MRRPESAIQPLNANHRVIVEADQIAIVVASRDVHLNCALVPGEQRDLQLKVHPARHRLVCWNRVQAREAVERALDSRKWHGAAAWTSHHPRAALLSNDDATHVGRHADRRQIRANLSVERDGRRTCWTPKAGAVPRAVRIWIRVRLARSRCRGTRGGRRRGFLGVAARERRAREGSVGRRFHHSTVQPPFTMLTRCSMSLNCRASRVPTFSGSNP